MNCKQVEAQDTAYTDGEAHAILGRSIDRHLAGCAACRKRQEGMASLRARIRAEAPYHAAPATLHARVRAALGAMQTAVPVAEQPRSLRAYWRWLAGGALGGALATALAFTLGTALVTARAQDDTARVAVNRHVMASLEGGLIAVASSDRHTVKPWLSARLEYSPPVRDFAADGFPLLGGRLDRIDGHAIGVLVYGYGQHTIDVFVWPNDMGIAAPAMGDVRGFHVRPARGATMSWVAVSDAEPEALADLVRRVSAEDTSR